MRRILGLARARRRVVLACGVVLGAGAFGTSSQAPASMATPTAKAARTVSLEETAHLEYSNQEIPGSEIAESGRATGTYNVPVRAGLTFHAHSMTAVVTVYLKGGSITATTNVSFEFVGEMSKIHGILTVSHATGTYKHASGQLSFRGAINRNYPNKMWAVTSGSAKY
jgi:hypothetical protein